VQEEARLKSLNNLLNQVGFDSYTYEDFVDQTINLLRQIAASLPNNQDDELIVKAFNDEDQSNGIVMHMRVRLTWSQS
jgi:ubiquitin thioesterase protein OTUB1